MALLASSTLAYMVNVPNGNAGLNWHGPHNPQPLAWSRVDTDPRRFDVVLVRQQPPFHKVIVSNVDGTRGKIYVPSPRGGFPVGPHFRVNLQEGDTILAQSNEFTIKF